MDTLTIIITVSLVVVVILVLVVYNNVLHNRITDTAVENDRLKRENNSLEKENKELADELDVVTGGSARLRAFRELQDNSNNPINK